MIKLSNILNEINFKMGKDVPSEFQSKLEDVLSRWMTNSDDETGNWLYKNLSTFKKLKTKYPNVFAPKKPNGTLLYRGLTKPSKDLIEFAKKAKQKKENFEKIKISGETWYKYKKPIKYKPHLTCQSWSESSEVAADYTPYTPVGGMTFVLQTQQDDNFLFNSAYMSYLAEEDLNKEVIHVGKNFPSGVYLLIKEEE